MCELVGILHALVTRCLDFRDRKSLSLVGLQRQAPARVARPPCVEQLIARNPARVLKLVLGRGPPRTFALAVDGEGSLLSHAAAHACSSSGDGDTA